jgi:hypothetical protein
MDAFLAAVRRILRQDGESLLNRAVSGLDKAKTRLENAAYWIADEINTEQESFAKERTKFYQYEAQSSARVDALSATWKRARRVANRIAGLVE